MEYDRINANKRFKGDAFKKIFTRFGILFILVTFIIIASLISPVFMSLQNVTNIIRQVSIVIIVACAETILLVAGMFDLSAGSTMALAGVLAASISIKTGSVFLGVLLAIIVGISIGFVNGSIVAKFNIPPFIVTLAMMSIARGLAFMYTGGFPIINIGNFAIIGQGQIWIIPYPIIIMVSIVVISWIILNRMKFGRYLYAIGGNQNAALASGIGVVKVKIMAYIIAGSLIGLGGAVLTSRLNSGLPNAAVGYEFDAITAVIIGGTSLSGGIGTISGTVIGALIIFVLNNILNLMNVSSYLQLVVKGIIIVIAVLVDVKTKAARMGE